MKTHSLYFRKLLQALFCVTTAICASLSYGQADSGFLGLLRQGDFNRLESETTALQQRFAAGHETEFGLRQAYRPLYALTEQDLSKLDDWQKAYPKSYAVRLVRGTYYKRAGFSARGGEFASRTPAEKFAAMKKLHARAVPELEASLSLTEKPYLSVFHLLDLSDGNRDLQKSLMDSGTRMLPSNRLIRGRYMHSLTPRWGGSYDEMREFLSYARRTGATKIGLMELEGILYDDMGDTAINQGDQDSAIRSFRKALELNDKVGPEGFGDPPFSKYYKCKLPDLRAFCR